MNSKRNSAGYMVLPEGSGEMTGSCSLNGFVEIYKRDITYKVITPISSDPEHKDDETPWVASIHDRFGFSDPIIARLMIQSNEILNAVLLKNADIDRRLIAEKMHAIKETLISCVKIQEDLEIRSREIIESINNAGLKLDQGGRCLNEFPQIDNLDTIAGNFLVYANRTIKLICEIPQLLRITTRSHSNFEYLKNELAASKTQDALCDFVDSLIETGKCVSDLRNYHEHPKEFRTVISNFKLVSSKHVSPPTWRVDGKSDKSEFIEPKMTEYIGYLFCAAESVFLLSIQEAMHDGFPFVFIETPIDEMNLDCPIRYHLSIDDSKLTTTIP